MSWCLPCACLCDWRRLLSAENGGQAFPRSWPFVPEGCRRLRSTRTSLKGCISSEKGCGSSKSFSVQVSLTDELLIVDTLIRRSGDGPGVHKVFILVLARLSRLDLWFSTHPWQSRMQQCHMESHRVLLYCKFKIKTALFYASLGYCNIWESMMIRVMSLIFN